MSKSVEHKSTAKRVIRELLSTYGTDGALELFSDVLRENVSGGKGRPRREEVPFQLAIKALTEAVKPVREAAEHASAVAAELARPKRKYTRKPKAELAPAEAPTQPNLQA